MSVPVGYDSVPAIPILESGSRPSWCPFQIVSLFEMLPFYADLFHVLSNEIHSFTAGLAYNSEKEKYVKDDDVRIAREIADLLLPHCERAEMKRSLERLEYLKDLLARRAVGLSSDFIRQMDELSMAIRKDLSEKCFMYVPDESLFYYSEYARPEQLSTKQPPLFGRLVHKNFKSTRFDVLEAGNCYAVGRYTACVFHCMRVLEKGLRAFVLHLNTSHNAAINFSKSVDETTWGRIIDEIQLSLENPSRVRRLNPLPTKDQRRDYSTAAIEFEHFKYAWRDDVSHSRRSYDQLAAKSVMSHVHAFMEKISGWGLKE